MTHATMIAKMVCEYRERVKKILPDEYGKAVQDDKAISLLAEEVVRLSAIVERLPKTADGAPVTPEMRVWTYYTDGDVFSDLASDMRHLDHGDYSRCYSTREAAEAATQLTSKGTQ